MSTTVRYISESFIKPKHTSKESKKPLYLTPWDLTFLSLHYNQKGLLYVKPKENFDISEFLEKLKHSLSLTLVHFYPLAGRLATSKSEETQSFVVYVECNDGPGARFIHAAVDMTVSDVVSPSYLPPVVYSFFENDNSVINYAGHSRPLLIIQVTELIDGIFIGCTINHCLADGTSFWNFCNTWSEIFRSQEENIDNVHITRPPIINRWFPDGVSQIINLPFDYHENFISRTEPPKFKEKVFHFASESVAKLKARANSELNTNKISSFQSLYALMWRSITRARRVAPDQKISCKMSADVRSRLNPPLSSNWFGNYIGSLNVATTAGELLDNNLGWAASQLNRVIDTEMTDEKVREWIDKWIQTPLIIKIGDLDPFCVLMGSSPRFSIYTCEFGLGKAVAVRSGNMNKFSGKITAYPGYEGGGSVDLEVCLSDDTMCALLSDEELLEFVSF